MGFFTQGKIISTHKVGGFHWPTFDQVGAPAILRHAARHFPLALDYVPRRKLTIQAGGNVGVYPVNLARYFERVHTFEPDAENYACLKLNVNGVDNVTPYELALGNETKTVGIKRHPTNAGAHRIEGDGKILMVKIDRFCFEECDLIWLDAEGYEPEILAGGEQTIKRFRPVIILEDMGLAGLGEGAARRWLETRGYRQAAQMLNDFVMVPN